MQNKAKGNHLGGRVQWTKEFMQKVRKSNEKYSKKNVTKNDKKFSLQPCNGDGIERG